MAIEPKREVYWVEHMMRKHRGVPFHAEEQLEAARTAPREDREAVYQNSLQHIPDRLDDEVGAAQIWEDGYTPGFGDALIHHDEGCRYSNDGILPLPNTVTDGDGFYISYNNRDTGIYDGDTTALVPSEMEKFYILKGDHRALYQEILYQGFEACLAYFQAHRDEVHPYSDRP